jgi:uncharacterized protein (TIGR02231 family)
MNTIETESGVSSVTVYQGRAMITRVAKVNLKEGAHTLVFPDMPAGLDSESLQVRGTGEATLGECSFETEYFSEDIDSTRRPLLDEQEKLADELSEWGLKLQLLGSEKTLVDNIASYVTTPVTVEGTGVPAAAPASGLEVSHWSGFTGFYRDKHSGIDQEKLAADRRIREINRKLKALEEKLAQLGRGSRRSRNIIMVGIVKKTAGELTLFVSYLLAGPFWKPVYNLRASGDSDKLVLEYDALVTQNTGEDWSGTELKLSTARVNVSGVIPELSPWRIALYRPAPTPMARSSSMKKAAKSSLADEDFAMGAAPAPACVSEASEEYQRMETEEAQVGDSGAGVVFTVAGGGSISGNNKETRVSLARREFVAEYLYKSVPKLSEFAYLTAKFKNSSEFPVLPGRVNIFFDGSLVAGSAFELMMPGQESEVSLGIDEGIKVEYRFIKRFKKNEGLVNKKVSEQFEYGIRITNNRQKPAALEVCDQFPVTQEKELAVKFLQPVIKENQKEVSLDDEAKITWSFRLEPAEKRELPVVYLVEYPVERSLSGI